MPCYLVPPGIRFNDCFFTEPVQWNAWRQPSCAGIVAILVRDPQWAPKPLQPLYFAEFGNGAPHALNSGANIPRENLLISVLPMPYSTRAQRRAICQDLIGAYNPRCQAGGLFPSAEDLARKVDALEARQQEQSQQILGLLAYIGKFFEPQPVKPRRPIGFLPQLSPGVAAETAS